MLLDVIAWLKTILSDRYDYSVGGWNILPDKQGYLVASISATGGAIIGAVATYPRARITLVGRKNMREDAATLLADMAKIVNGNLFEDSLPCGVVNLRAVSTPVGPMYTADNRAYTYLDVEIIY